MVSVYPSSQLSGQAYFISMAFRCLCSCHSLQISLHLYQQNKSSESKLKFRQASNGCKSFFEAAKPAYVNKKKSPSLPRNLALRTSGKLPIVVSVKVNIYYTIPPLFNGPEVLPFVIDKAKLFAENFSKNSNFDDSGISLHVFPSRT